MPPTVSILTRTRNRPLLLPRACASVLGQSFGDWEHLIINDGGDAASLEAQLRPLEATYNGRLRILHRPLSHGMEAASNAGLAIATGTFLAIHDDDDSWSPRFLQKMVGALSAYSTKNLVQGVVCAVTRVVERLTAEGVEECFRHPFTPEITPLRLWRLLEENLFPPIAFLFRHETAIALGGFDETLPVLGDWDFNVRFLLRHAIATLPEKLAFYHHRTDGAEAVYANTVTAQDGLHRETEARLIKRWAESKEGTLRALSAATGGARANLLQRRENNTREARTTALQTARASLQ